MREVERDLLERIRVALDEKPIRRKVFIDRWRETADWPASYAQASRRLAQWLDEADHHRFPVEALPDLVRAVGSASFLDGLLGLERRVQRERRAREGPHGEAERGRAAG